MVPLATGKVAVVQLLVLMLSISTSKHPTRGTISHRTNANNRVYEGRTGILFLSELCSFSSFCLSMMLAEKKSNGQNCALSILKSSA